VLALTDEPTFPGCQIDCRLIGALLARQKDKDKEVRNDCIVAAAEASVVYSDVDLSSIVLKQIIEDFFVDYQRVRQIEVIPLGREGAGLRTTTTR
jgi:inorganic pyrophosphatase